MTYDELVSSVEAAAVQKNREILERASREAEEILRSAEKRAVDIKDGYLKESLRRAGVERNRMIYLNGEEIKASHSLIKKELFLQAFFIAKENLDNIRNSPGYPELFKRLLLEAIHEAGDGEYLIHITSIDKSICETIVIDHHIQAQIVTDLECTGGLSLSSSDGKIMICNTIESRLERTQDVLKLEIFNELR
jgi:V/A-type H+/Na+-transporting ATPase subunit E